MSGKPYNIGELKIIVDYLVENKLYGETRARKMWVDFANTKLTTRTWQSLKETFLKRILPDIHNPYFKLSNEQISSFRARCDLANKNQNKLEIHSISDESNSNGHDLKDKELTNNEGETTAGENIKCSKVPVRSRSSADTVILENCYETAEEIQKELEATESDEKPTAASKSLRDCITYSEPLTPMLQEVLDDFASEPEDSDREGQMEIVENVPENDNSENIQEIPEPNPEMIDLTKSITTDVAKNGKGVSAEVVEEVLAQELEGSKQETKSSKKNTSNLTDKIEELPEVNLFDDISSMQAENGTDKEDDTEMDGAIVSTKVSEEPIAQTSENSDPIVGIDSHSEPQVQSSGINNSNSTVDASLPNNPEALKNKESDNVGSKNKEAESVGAETNNAVKTSSPNKTTRKRSCSVDDSNTIDNKKKKLEIKSKPPVKTDKKVTDSHLDTNKEDKLKGNEEFIKPDVIKKPWLEETPIDLNKPSTSFETHVVDIIETEKRNGTKGSPEIKNPCLQNVSLFDEQFNKTKYNMSESSDTEQNKKETKVDKQDSTVLNSPNDVEVPKSHSDSDTREVQTPPKKKHRSGVLISKSERDKAIANMFGFPSGGGVGSKRKRQLSRRRRTISHNNSSQHNPAPASNSSDWTSESGSEAFVSPPRSRKNRPTRKYLKPRAARIASLEEEGGLFIMYGKKIYPLIKDGKIVKNYITYLPESDSEEGESFWKLKYVEEKKKAAELKKLLEEVKEPRQSEKADSPVPQANPLGSSRSSPVRELTNGVVKETCAPGPDEKKEETKVNPPEKIKIKFMKNNEEVQLEGHWPQIHPVLEQVVQIFHKEAEPSVSEYKSKMLVMHPEQPKELSSGTSTPVIISTPVDPEVHEKVNEIEKEIFQEIEQRDREEENEPNGRATNVTQRKMGRTRKSSSSSFSPEKKPKSSNGLEEKDPKETKDSHETKVLEEYSRTRKQKAKVTENNNNTQEAASKRQTRTPRKYLNETINTNESKTVQTRRSKQSLESSTANEDDEVKYMLPPRNSRRSLKSPANKMTNRRKSSGIIPKIFSSPDDVSLNSMDSTLGYQDSDVSLVNTGIRRKKKIDISNFMIKTRNSLRRSTRRNSQPYIYHNAYNDSSNSSVDARIRVGTRENSSLNTEAYRSESYQLLNPQAKDLLRRLEPIDEKTPVKKDTCLIRHLENSSLNTEAYGSESYQLLNPRVSSSPLEPIDETHPINNETYFIRHLESICRNEISAQINKNSTGSFCQMTSDVGSSSNVSLPMSPELSVVENLSVSKELLITADFPTINEMQSNEIVEGTLCGKYMITDVDVSVPLMNQECELESCNTVTEMSTEPKSLITESLLNKIGTFNINDEATGTDTLNKKLHGLLLQSAKKATGSQSVQKEASMMDVDVARVELQNKPKANKKRCSTPRKRKGAKKSVAPTVDPVVEEEHVDSCSRNGTKSCPPLFQTHLCNDNVVTEEINIANLTIANENPKGSKKKKDIIRVKIQRPKTKKATQKLRTKSAQNASRISVFTDSGINDSASEVFPPANNSVDLIHNHSETCLHATECLDDSIEFVESSTSVITLGDSLQSGDNPWNSRSENNEHSTSPDFLFCNNAQDVSFYNKPNTDIDSTSNTVYYTPLGTEASPNSLITEDQSDEIPSSKWYLLSDDEPNTNLVGTESTMLSSGGYGSNLKKLFPIACAIPDLSTITEMSKENDSSRKPALEDFDGLAGDDFNTLSVFDSNF